MRLPVLLSICFLLLVSVSRSSAQPYYLLDSSLKHGYELYLLGDYDQAGAYYLKALKKAQKEGNKRIEAESYRSLGEVNRASQNRTFALKYLDKAEQLFNRIGDEYGIANTKNRLAACYFEMGDTTRSRNYLNSSYKICKDRQFLDIQYNNLTIMGALEFFKQKNFQGAIMYLSEAYKLAEVLQREEDYPYIFNNLTRVYREIGKPDSALHYAHLALEYAQKYEVRTYMASAYGQLSLLYSDLNRYKEAYEYERLYNLHTDTIYNESRDKEVAEIVERYQNEKQEEQLRRQSVQLRYTIFLALVFLAMLLVMVYLVLHSRKQRRSLAKAQLESESRRRLLEENNRVKDKLISVLSHDLRSPVAALSSSLDIIRSSDVDKEETLRLMDELAVRVERTAQLIDNLLFWIKNQLDRTQPQPVQVNLLSETNGVALLQETAISQKDLRLEISIPKDLNIRADREMIRLALRNLLSNAIKFSHPSGRILITATRWDKYTELIVSDEGVGMSSDKLDQLFEVQQVTSTGTYEEIGMGLGLSIVRDFVQINGGEIKVSSDVNKGSSFYLRFPN